MLDGSRLESGHELIEFLFRFFLGIAVSLFQKSGELISLSRDHRQVVVCQFAPFFLDSTSELLPVAVNLIPVHFLILLRNCYARAIDGWLGFHNGQCERVRGIGTDGGMPGQFDIEISQRRVVGAG